MQIKCVLAIGRFASADTIVPQPGEPQSLNRYSYSLNNPVKYRDPSGHYVCSFSNQWCGGVERFVKGQLSLWDPFRYTVTGPRVTPPHSNNMTGWLADQMVTTARGPIVAELRKNLQIWSDPFHAWGAMQGWIALVRTGAVWDFKPDIVRADVTFDEGAQTDLVTLGNRNLNYQAVANIFYGFIGRVSGFTEGQLRLGAGLAQVKDWGIVWKNVNFKQLGDEAFDVWSISFGFFLYDLYGNDLDALTQEAFIRALEEYISKYGEAPSLE